MTEEDASPPASLAKPLSRWRRAALTRLPRLTLRRRLFRRFILALARFVIRLAAQVQVRGLENVPRQGPLLAVSNHLGDADVLLGLAYSPRPAEALAKIELYEFPLLGWLMDAYGFIWVHRGQPDRRALRAALQGLGEGRLVGIAPEGRESLTGALEEGTHGAAYLALKSGAPVLPITITGTENSVVYTNLKHLRRSNFTLTMGKPFTLVEGEDRQEAIRAGTVRIMQALAEQLPPEYRGVYGHGTEESHGS